MKVNLSQPQYDFLLMPQKFRAFVGGYGSGKTVVGSCGLITHHELFPHVNSGYFAPTYRDIKDVFYPTIDEVAFWHGWKTLIKLSDKEVHLFKNGAFMGVIFCRSLDRPHMIVGFKIGKALVDELDTLPVDKAKTAWNKIIARMRIIKDGLRNGIDVTTTPEGFKFTYDRFVRNATASYGIIQASSLANARNLPPDYIPSLYETYPAELVDAYIHGKFTNLTAGTVYHSFSRFLNDAPGVFPKEGEPLYIGVDFNVGQMSAIIHVLRPYFCYIAGRRLVRAPFAVGEIVDAFDTPALIRTIQETYPGHHITAYPDSTGKNRHSTNASESDIKLLKHAGFEVKARNKNPFIKDRVNSMNAAFANAQQDRLYRVNVSACPRFTECLEQQAYDKNGMPDKEQGLDHLPDAAGYFIEREFGLIKPLARRVDLY